MRRSAAPAGRVTEYEWMRLLATVLVVVGHSVYWNITTAHGGVYYSSDELAWISPVYLTWPFALLGRAAGWVYGFHMAAFFFLSGAVLALRPVGAVGPFLAKKAKRLLLPYAVCGLLWMFPLKLLTGFYTPQSLPQALAAFALGGDDSGHLWFLLALFWCMTTFALLEKTADWLLRGGAAVLKLPVLLLAAAALHLGSGHIPQLFGLRNAAQYFIWFVLGWAFEPVRRAIAALPARRGTLVYAAGFTAVIGGWYAAARLGLAGARLTMLLGCAWLYLLAALCARLLRRAESTRLWRTVTASLFWVYLVHDPLEHLLLHLFMENRWLAFGAGCGAYLLARTAGVFAFSVAVYVLRQKLQGKFSQKQRMKAL